MHGYGYENPNPKPHNRSHFNSVDKYKLLTFFLSLMEPFPRTIILQPVSCSNCLVVMPRGPKIRPTKLNCKWKSENLGHRYLDDIFEYWQTNATNLSKFPWTMVFCYQNCSDLLWEKNVLVIEKNFWNSRPKAKNLQNFWDHTRTIYSNVRKVRKIFGNRMLF